MRITILNLHGMLANNLLDDPDAPGKHRHISVGISGSAFLPLDVPQLIEECVDQVLATAAAIKDPFEQAFFAMAQLPYLQPFDDVNKCVSRLAANIPLIKNNLSPLSFADVPKQTYTEGMLGVYELSKIGLLRTCSLGPMSARQAAMLPCATPSASPIRSGFACAPSCVRSLRTWCGQASGGPRR